jgi:hypothetical protein
MNAVYAAKGDQKMEFYSIGDESNNVAVHSSAKEADAVRNSERFSNEAALARLAVNWPTSRLVSIWNNLAGETPVRKFRNRKLAVSRIWQSVQRLGGDRMEDRENEKRAPESPAKRIALQRPEAVSEASGENDIDSRPSRIAATNAETHGKTGNRSQAILALLKQPEGTTLGAIVQSTGWQAHSVRGFISGTVRNKMGLNVISTRDESGVRTYRIEA